jgi:hypothetical protein
MNNGILSVITGFDLQGNHNKQRRIKYNYDQGKYSIICDTKIKH